MEYDHSIGFAIRSLSNLLRRKMLEQAPLPQNIKGLSETEGLIMGFLCDHAGQELYQKDVEEVFCIRRSTASRFLIRLEREGMLLRESVFHDARCKRLIPTEKAKELHKEILEKSAAMERLMKTGLSKEEEQMFFSVVRKIEKNLS